MSGILDILTGSHGKELIEGSSKQFGLNRAATGALMASAIPLILGALKNNSSTDDGAKGILGALGNDKHSGSFLDNLGSIFADSKVDDNVMNDGGKILNHVFGGKENHAAEALGKNNKMDLGSVMNIMKVAAPFVLGYMGKKSRQHNIQDKNGLSDMLGGLLGSDEKGVSELASLIQGFDQNDKSIDDISKLLTNQNKKTGGIGDVLTGIFG